MVGYFPNATAKSCNRLTWDNLKSKSKASMVQNIHYIGAFTMFITVIVYLLYLPILMHCCLPLAFFSISFPNLNCLSNHCIYKFSLIDEEKKERKRVDIILLTEIKVRFIASSIQSISLGCVINAAALPAACHQRSQAICSTIKLEKYNHC